MDIKILYDDFMFKVLSGIDEAALGPILGPYCCALTSFEVTNNIELFDVFSEFKKVIVGDSKKLYKSGKSIRDLENTALSFYSSFCKTQPTTLMNLLSNLIIDKKHLNELCAIPWFNNIKNLQLPIKCDSREIQMNSDNLTEFLKIKKLKIKNIKVDVVSADRFNKILLNGFNKSQCCQQILGPLLKDSLDDQSRLTVDRQGGRRYYGEWLIDIYPGTNISVNKETQDLSSYNISNSIIQFQVKGDEKFLETALASIFSKYIRELMMICFNDYWVKTFPDIKSTAGYPLDGKRFINDLNSRGADYNKMILIRQK